MAPPPSDKQRNTPKRPTVGSNNVCLPFFLLHSWNGALNQTFFPIALPDDEDLKIPPKWDLEQMAADSPDTFTMPSALTTPTLPASYEPPRPFNSSVPVGDSTWDKYLEHIIDREGYSRTVYPDSLGKPTVGVGHLVKEGEPYKIGDQISDLEVRTLLETDARDAYKAAIEQANELGINDSNFVIALGSVNFQLGTNWRQEFPKTWEKMQNGDFQGAAIEAADSRWAQQTPTRLADFQNALREAGQLRNSPTAIAALETPKTSLSQNFDNKAEVTATGTAGATANNTDYTNTFKPDALTA